MMVVLILLGTIPISSNAQKKPKGKVIVPAWKIQIVDEAGNPVKGVFVRQVWRDYDTEDDDHEADAWSDNNGYIVFPERREKGVSELARTKGRLKNRIRLGVHASFGIHAYILAWGEIVGCRRLEGNANYEEGKPPPTRLQMRTATLPGYKCTPLEFCREPIVANKLSGE